MRIVFFGTPEFAVPTLQKIIASKHNVVGVVTSESRRSGRGLKNRSTPVKSFADKMNLNLIEISNLLDRDFILQLKSFKADVFIVVAFRILPREIFEIPNSGTINLHASLLPKYRGSSPIQYAILNNEKETGVTTFKIQKELDAGKIYKQKKINISSMMNFGDIHDKLSVIGADLMLDTINYIDSNIKDENLINQNENLVTFAPKISSLDCKIDWNMNARCINNVIRAFSPKPGAYTYLFKKRVKIFKSSVFNLDFPLNVGQISVLDDKIIVGTKKEKLLIDELQIEGRKRMSSSDFIRGFLLTNKDDYIGFN